MAGAVLAAAAASAPRPPVPAPATRMPVPLRFRLTHPARCRAPAACWHRHPAQDTAPPARSFDSWHLSCSGAEPAAPVQYIDHDTKRVLDRQRVVARESVSVGVVIGERMNIKKK